MNEPMCILKKAGGGTPKENLESFVKAGQKAGLFVSKPSLTKSSEGVEEYYGGDLAGKDYATMTEEEKDTYEESLGYEVQIKGLYETESTEDPETGEPLYKVIYFYNWDGDEVFLRFCLEYFKANPEDYLWLTDNEILLSAKQIEAYGKKPYIESWMYRDINSY